MSKGVNGNQDIYQELHLLKEWIQQEETYIQK